MIDAGSNEHELDQLVSYFGETITKPLSKKWLTKENGYASISRFYEQRLFNMLYQILYEKRDTAAGISLIMQSCSLVPFNTV